jgi:hypothetical protein
LLTTTVSRWTRGAGIAATLGIVTAELLRCASLLTIPDGLASSALAVLVLAGTPWFIGMAVRQWLLAILGAVVGLYVLVWACHLLSGIPIYYDPPLGIILMLIYPVGWLAVALGWLGSRVPWIWIRVQAWANR